MPRQSQGKNRLRIRRELPFRSKQRTVSRASVDIQTVPGVVGLVLTSFAPDVAVGIGGVTIGGMVGPTPILVTPGTATLTLTGFAPTVTAIASVLVTPAAVALVLQGFAPTVQGDRIPSTDASGGGTKIRLLRETEIFTGALPFKNLPNDPLPEQAPLSKPSYIAPVIDNTAAIAALYADGALTEDEFAVLLAA